MNLFMMASEEAKGSFCRDDSCVVTNQLATDPGALERELLTFHPALPLQLFEYQQ